MFTAVELPEWVFASQSGVHMDVSKMPVTTSAPTDYLMASSLFDKSRSIRPEFDEAHPCWSALRYAVEIPI